MGSFSPIEKSIQRTSAESDNPSDIRCKELEFDGNMN